MKEIRKLFILAAALAVSATIAWCGVENTQPASSSPKSTDWSAAKIAYSHWLQTSTATPAEKDLITRYLHRNNSPRLDGNPLDNQGGPDGFGYRYVDNQGGDTATFAWIELCGDNNATNGPEGDDNDAVATIGWSFPFYGGSYGSVYVSTNGFMRFDGSNDTYTNTCPLETQTDEPGPMIAPYWDDMYAIGTGGCTNNGSAPWIRWRNFAGNYFVVEWSQITHFPGSADRFSYEAILYPNGKIKFQYNTGWNDSENPNSASIGIDAQAANQGLAYRCDAAGNNQITGGRAIWFYVAGAPQNGRCCYGDPMNPSCADNLPSDCAGLGGTWTGGLTCANDPCPLCADFSVTAPGTWTGNTCSAGDSCNLRTGPEVIHAVTIPNGGLLCSGPSPRAITTRILIRTSI